MQNMNSVNWFEIPTTNLARAQNFYERVFNVKLQEIKGRPGVKMVMFPGAHEYAGAMGVLVHSETEVPSQQGALVYFHCQDLSEELKRVEENDGKVLLPKTAIGEDSGYMAYFCDTEGNRVALHSMQ
jgi:uncharacterized protein